MAPFTFNFASLALVPLSLFQARTAEEQVDMLYELADNPNTPKDRATALAMFAGKLMMRLNKSMAPLGRHTSGSGVTMPLTIVNL